MKVRITVKRDRDIIHAVDAEVEKEGDIEVAVSTALRAAREKTGFGPQWGFAIYVDRV